METERLFKVSHGKDNAFDEHAQNKMENQKVINNFRPKASAFDEFEETNLHINIQPTDDTSCIFSVPDEGIITALKDFLLPSYDASRIREFSGNDKGELNDVQQQFLTKLKDILCNRDSKEQESKYKQLVGDLLDLINHQLGLDGEGILTLRPSELRLQVGSSNQFEMDVTKEGHRRNVMIWLVQDTKHPSSNESYKCGDVQMAAAMIAAVQYNHRMYKRVCPKKLFGIKLVGDTMFFTSMHVSDEYLDELNDGLPHKSVVMHRYPEKGLSLANPNERKEALKGFSHMCREAMSF